MNHNVKRLFVEKKPGFDVEAQSMLKDLKYNLGVSSLSSLRVLNRYDICGISTEEFNRARDLIFSEKNVDNVYELNPPVNKKSIMFAVEYLPGQYDQRADSACQCIQILTQKEEVMVSSSKVIIIEGNLSKEDIMRIKAYCINPVDSREASLSIPSMLSRNYEAPKDVEIIEGFLDFSHDQLEAFIREKNLAMSTKDLYFCRDYFKGKEKRNPSITELKVIDTYWSDHCRHTTFMTNINDVHIEKGAFSQSIEESFIEYKRLRAELYNNAKKNMCLMDIATIGMKELSRSGILKDLDVSDEINACSIEIDVELDEKDEKWLLMFKNETHNHPTEVEPFGGAATCVGGAIRDPLSGRAYVYQAMRVTGSGDPRESIEAALPGKLPQRKISIGAAQGFSAYGNQIGLSTGQVTELYDEGFKAKRMEIGAVIAAAPKECVVREKPAPGDVVILVGGRTGRDGCGGATGSSKAHDEKSILICGAEVQKGNPVTERKLQRLFRNPEVSKVIKRCNDFGAGGVSVAIGELAEGLDINLDLIPKKYEGLDGTELAISESQERMAVVVSAENVDKLLELIDEENLEAAVVARVTGNRRLIMRWRDKVIVDISRDFLDTNGIKESTDIIVNAPEDSKNYFKDNLKHIEKNLRETWISTLRELSVCSQRGLAERFDSTIGAGTVLLPFGGKYQSTPAEGMAAKIPVLEGETNTASLMAYGYNPKIGKWSPFHGALYAVIEAVTKIVAMGGDYKNIRLSLQEYFEALRNDPSRWGKPFAALLGALKAQLELGIPAIGGKDSMSGSFMDLDVPPTLVAFAVATTKAHLVLSPEFKKTKSKVILIEALRNKDEMPDFKILKKNFEAVTKFIKAGGVLSAFSVRAGGICEAISKACFGNKIGFKFESDVDNAKIFTPSYGSLILELDESFCFKDNLEGVNYRVLGYTQQKSCIELRGQSLSIDELYSNYENPLEDVFPTKTNIEERKIQNISYEKSYQGSPVIKIAKPRILIPVFPGTNCEYDSQKAFENAGGIVDTIVFRNMNTEDIIKSLSELEKKIKNSQIVMLPGGFSAGDEPDGSGKFIAAVFRNERVKEAIMGLIKNKDGLMLGICNGFQALIKLGLVPYGEIRDIDEESPTLTYNSIGRHVSCMAKTKVVSKLSPWLSNLSLGDTHTIPISHGEGRFVCSENEINRLISNGQIAFQYVDYEGNASYSIEHNPNGSFYAVEAITSPDGRILGKMGHSERIGKDISKNIPGEKDQRLFKAGVDYFK